MSQVHAIYAAVSWSVAAFLGVYGACWLVRPRSILGRTYWPFVFKAALISGTIVGVLTLLLGADFIWKW